MRQIVSACKLYQHIGSMWHHALCIVAFMCAGMLHSTAQTSLPDTIPLAEPLTSPSEVIEDKIITTGDSIDILPVDTIPVDLESILFPGDKKGTDISENIRREFNPDPNRAVWLSALCPGLGQFYNRRYWKLPLVVGGFMGLGYATSWNNSMLTDYTRAYRDLMDSDPGTNSYMNFFPPNTVESNLDKSWLENLLKSRKNYFRRNRDLCIICMVGVYFLAMVDAYVDASLSHFDISPELALHWAPAVMPQPTQSGIKTSVGLQWALRF